MNEIITLVLEKELQYKDTVILSYKIEYPKIVMLPYRFGKEMFNNHNRNQAIALQTYCEQKLFQEAKELYEYNISNGYPVMKYEIILTYTITYDENYIISLYSDEYMFTGGAHGTTTRNAQNWNLKEGKQFLLASLYPNDSYFLLNILKDINKQIQEQMQNGSNDYFDDYCRLVLQTFNPANFYLYLGYIEIFFQQYDIAPYSSGIPTFKIERK